MLNKPQIQIGIASGRMISGYTSTQHHATFTCIGDTVNLAARIEDHTKIAARRLLIDRSTREKLTERIGIEALGAVLFKGKSVPVEIFAVRPV